MSETHGYFTKQADAYASARPTYPEALYRWIVSHLQVEGAVAWDCATGSGQVARGLVEHVGRVIATDVSAEQLERAPEHPRITYAVASAEDSGLEAHSVDLVTAAAALHWFDAEGFYAEVRRVVRPGGVIAVWTYGGNDVTPQLDAVGKRYAREVVHEFWDERLKHVWAHYETLPFPFERFEAPAMQTSAEMTLERYATYLRSWSASQRYADARGVDPLECIDEELREAWGQDPEHTHVITWDLHVLAGRV